MRNTKNSKKVEVRVPYYMYYDLQKLKCRLNFRSLSELIKFAMSGVIVRLDKRFKDYED